MALTTDQLIGISFGLAISAVVGTYWTIREWRLDTRPQDLKTFSAMRWAFRLGRKTSAVDRRRSSAVFAMRKFAEQGADAAQREMIAVMMRKAITELLQKSDNRSANEVWKMLETLAAAAPVWEADFLEEVSRSKLEGWARGRAVERLVRLGGPKSLDFLLAMVDDSAVAHAVALAIARLGPRAATPEALARLRRMLDDRQNGWAPSAAARALIALGQATEPTLVAHLDRFEPWTRFGVRVMAARLNAFALVDRLLDAGVIDEGRRKSIKPQMITKMQKALRTGDASKAVTNLLERLHAIYSFDTEWDPVPDYRELLNRLSKIGSSQLRITDIDVQLDGEMCREVNCKIAGHPARFNPEFMGDWTDLEAVLKGLNSGLAAAGRSERFASLFTGDQTACVIIGRADGLSSLVETLGLPLDSNANAGVAIGIAAENHAAEQIKAEFPGVTIVRG